MWLKNFRNRKLQTFICGIIILLCALLLSTSMSILSSLNEPMEQLIEECESGDAVVYPNEREYKDKVLELAKRLEDMDEVKKAVCISKHYVNEKITFNGKEVTTFTNLTEYNGEVFGNVRCIDGDKKSFDNLKTGECVIPACISAENNISVGDTVTIKGPEKELDFKVKGIYADIYSTSNAFDNYILINKVPDELFIETNIRIYFNQEIKEEQFLDRYEEVYGKALEGQLNTKENALESSLLAVKVLGGILLAVGAVMLFTCCLIINFVLRSIMTSDAKTIAIYKTMGYNNQTIRNLYGTFYLVLTTVSIWIGVVSSKFVANQILNDLFANIGMKANVKVLKSGFIIYAVVILLVLATVYLVTGRMKNMKPVHALGSVSPTNTVKNQHYKGNYKFAFSPVGIASRMIMRDKKGAARILIVSIVSVIGINFGLISLDVAFSMKDNNDYWLGIDRSDIVINLSSGSEAKDIQELLEEDKNVKKAIPSCMSGAVVVEREKNSKDAVVYPFIYEDYDEVDMPVVTGRNPKSEKEIAISGKISETVQKDIGDYITLNFGRMKKSFLITGLYQTYYNMGASCRLTADAYKDIPFSYEILSVYLKDNQDIDGEVERLSDKFNGVGNIIPRTEQLASIMELIAKPQENAIPVVTAMVFMIGCINVFCIIMLKNQKDVKVNSIYKCLGYTSSHLMAANVCYVSLLALFSIVIAVPVILYTYPMIMKLTLGTMFGLLEYRVKYNMVHILVGNIAIFGLFIISTLLSSRGIRKIHVRDLVIE